MTTLVAHFDGKALVPDESVDLPVNQPLMVSVESLPAETGGSPCDVDERVWLNAASSEQACGFLRDEPDVYQSTDGHPFEDTR